MLWDQDAEKEFFWEGPVEEIGNAPDLRPRGNPDGYGEGPDGNGGVIWMWGITDDDRVVSFAYHDVYYIYRNGLDQYVAGAGTKKVDFIFHADGTEPMKLPVLHPPGAWVRYGVFIPNEEADRLGLRLEFQTVKTGLLPEDTDPCAGCAEKRARDG